MNFSGIEKIKKVVTGWHAKILLFSFIFLLVTLVTPGHADPCPGKTVGSQGFTLVTLVFGHATPWPAKKSRYKGELEKTKRWSRCLYIIRGERDQRSCWSRLPPSLYVYLTCPSVYPTPGGRSPCPTR